MCNRVFNGIVVGHGEIAVLEPLQQISDSHLGSLRGNARRQHGVVSCQRSPSSIVTIRSMTR
jgi:hypothetical protein